MAKVAVAVRLMPEVVARVDMYARGRGVSRQVIYESAIVGFLELAKSGVPDLVVRESARDRLEAANAEEVARVEARRVMMARQVRLNGPRGVSKPAGVRRGAGPKDAA